MDFAIYIWCNKRLIMYRHLIRIRKGGGYWGGGGGWGFKRNAIMSFYWLCWNQMPHVLWGKWRSLWPVFGTNFPLFFVIVKINTFSRIRPITFSKALLTEFFVLCYCIYEYQADLLDMRRESIAVLIDITLSSAWPYTNVYVIFGRSAPFTGKQR